MTFKDNRFPFTNVAQGTEISLNGILMQQQWDTGV